jgi:hypothetical protein
MIRDPRARGVALAALLRRLEASLWGDLEESGLLTALPPGGREHARGEWEALAMYACVRGLVAAGGFNTETAAAVDALHETVAAGWDPEPGADGRRARLAERYAEYGRIGQELEATGAAHVARRLGEACAAHVAGGMVLPGLADTLGALHEALAEGAAAAVRCASDTHDPAAPRSPGA